MPHRKIQDSADEVEIHEFGKPTERDMAVIAAWAEEDAKRRARGNRRKFHFERGICIGDIMSVLALVGALSGGIWFAATQSSKIDRVSATQETMQLTVTTLQTDVAGIKADVAGIKSDIHDVHDQLVKK